MSCQGCEWGSKKSGSPTSAPVDSSPSDSPLLTPPPLTHPCPAAQQEAQRAQFIVERAKQERQQKVVQAEGEAEAARMISSTATTLVILS